MQIKKDTKFKVTYRLGLGTGAVLQVAEASGGYTQVDVVFEKDGKRFLETFPQNLLRRSLHWKEEKAIVGALFDIGMEYNVIFSPLFT